MMSADLLAEPGRLIREMTEQDLEQVQGIDRLSFSMPWPMRSFQYELKENPNSLLWVAESTAVPGEILGFVVVWLILDEAHIATIAVQPNYRQQGIARQLLVTAIHESLRRESSLVTLEVRAGNAAAQNLYRQFNFSVVGVRPKYYKDNLEDALIMTASRLELDDMLRTFGQPATIPEEVV